MSRLIIRLISRETEKTKVKVKIDDLIKSNWIHLSNGCQWKTEGQDFYNGQRMLNPNFQYWNGQRQRREERN